MARLRLDGRAGLTWRERWQTVRDLLGGALILVVWASLWAWVAAGVGAPLSRAHGELSAPSAAHELRS